MASTPRQTFPRLHPQASAFESPPSSGGAQELTKGVLPARRVIEMGIADPKRLAIMGHSYPGYSTYRLITQTNRFHVAISLAGPADVVNMYGEFLPTLRYTAFPHEDLRSFFWSEDGQGRMGNPPWKDLERYVRNSPLFHVDHVETPVMIIQVISIWFR